MACEANSSEAPKLVCVTHTPWSSVQLGWKRRSELQWDCPTGRARHSICPNWVLQQQTKQHCIRPSGFCTNRPFSIVSEQPRITSCWRMWNIATNWNSTLYFGHGQSAQLEVHLLYGVPNKTVWSADSFPNDACQSTCLRILLIVGNTNRASAILVMLRACRTAKPKPAVPECSCVPHAPTAYELAFPREQACQGTNHVMQSSHILSPYLGHINHVWTVPAAVLLVGTGML